MTTSSGRNGFCERCGHALNEHAKKSDSKCKKCKKYFEICQQNHLESGYRLCYIPCSCGNIYYPDKAMSAKPLKPHEHLESHPGYRPPDEDDEEDDNEDELPYSTSPQAATSPKTQGAHMHSRNISEDSEDPLQWSNGEYIQNMTMPDLTKALANTSIDDEALAGVKDKGPEDLSQWCEWEWHEENQCEYRSRQKDGKWEYEYRNRPIPVPATATAKPISVTKTPMKPSKSEASKSKSRSKSTTSSKPPRSSKSSKATDWNEWEWSKEYKCDYRSRKNEDGEWQYEYRQREG